MRIKWIILILLLLLWITEVLAQIIGPTFTGLIAQANPPATTLTTIYTVLPKSSATLTTVWVTNRDTAQHTFRLAIARNGAADSPAQYIYWNVALLAGQSLIQAVNVTLNDGDQVRVYVDAQQLSFSLYGVLAGQLPTPVPT